MCRCPKRYQSNTFASGCVIVATARPAWSRRNRAACAVPNAQACVVLTCPRCVTSRRPRQVLAASLNFPDALQVRGLYQVKPPLPFIPGSEVAGVVTEAGAGVTGFKPGDMVSVTHQPASQPTHQLTNQPTS